MWLANQVGLTEEVVSSRWRHVDDMKQWVTAGVLALGVMANSLIGLVQAAGDAFLTRVEFLEIDGGRTEMLLHTDKAGSVDVKPVLEMDTKWEFEISGLHTPRTVQTDFSQSHQVSHVIIRPIGNQRLRLTVRGEQLGKPLIAFRQQSASDTSKTDEGGADSLATIAMDEQVETSSSPDWLNIITHWVAPIGAGLLLIGGFMVASLWRRREEQDEDITPSRRERQNVARGRRFRDVAAMYHTEKARRIEPALPADKPVEKSKDRLPIGIHALKQAVHNTQEQGQKTIEGLANATRQAFSGSPAANNISTAKNEAVARYAAQQGYASRPSRNGKQAAPTGNAFAKEHYKPASTPLIRPESRHSSMNQVQAEQIISQRQQVNNKPSRPAVNNGDSNGDVLDFLRNVAEMMERDGDIGKAQKLGATARRPSHRGIGTSTTGGGSSIPKDAINAAALDAISRPPRGQR